MTDKKFKVQMIDQLSINILFNYPHPFSREIIVNKLTEKKFEPIQSNISDILPVRSAQIAKKDGVIIEYVPEKGIIGVSGNDFSNVSKHFMELIPLINKIMGTEIDSNIIKLYEIILHVRISYLKESKEITEPREVISNFIGKEKLKIFENIVKDSSFFTIRIAPKNGFPSNTDWYDIVIEPLYINPKQYHIGIVFRAQDIEKIKEFADDIENKIINIASLIDQG